MMFTDYLLYASLSPPLSLMMIIFAAEIAYAAAADVSSDIDAAFFSCHYAIISLFSISPVADAASCHCR